MNTTFNNNGFAIQDTAPQHSNNPDNSYASVELLRRYPNLVVLRTFSRVYGLAGLRAGYALCGAAEFRQAVDQVRQPFNLNIAAQAAAVEALRHQDAVEQRVAHTLAARMGLVQELEQLDVRVADSDANFLWVHVADEEDATERAAVANRTTARLDLRRVARTDEPA